MPSLLHVPPIYLSLIYLSQPTGKLWYPVGASLAVGLLEPFHPRAMDDFSLSLLPSIPRTSTPLRSHTSSPLTPLSSIMSDNGHPLHEDHESRHILRSTHLERFKVDALRALLKKWTGTERVGRMGKAKFVEQLAAARATISWGRVRAWVADVDAEHLPSVPPPGCDASTKEWQMDLCMYQCIQNGSACYPLQDLGLSDESQDSPDDPDADADGEWDDEEDLQAHGGQRATPRPESPVSQDDHHLPASHGLDLPGMTTSRPSTPLRPFEEEPHDLIVDRPEDVVDDADDHERGSLVQDQESPGDGEGGDAFQRRGWDARASEGYPDREEEQHGHGFPARVGEAYPDGQHEQLEEDNGMNVDLFPEDDGMEALENFIRRAMRALQMCGFLDPTFVRPASEDESFPARPENQSLSAGIIDPATLTPEHPLYLYRNYMEEPPEKRLNALPADAPPEPWAAGRYDGRGSILAVGRDYRGLGPHDEGKRVSVLLPGVWMQYLSVDRVFTARSDDLARALARCPLLVEGNVYVTLVIDVDTRPSSIALAAFDSTGGIYMDETRFDVELSLLDAHLKRSPTLLSTYFKIEFELRSAFGVIPLKRGRTLSMENVAALDAPAVRTPSDIAVFKAPQLPTHAPGPLTTRPSREGRVKTSRLPPPSERSTTAYEDQSVDSGPGVPATLSPVSSRAPSELSSAQKAFQRAPQVPHQEKVTSVAGHPRKAKPLNIVEPPHVDAAGSRPIVPKVATSSRQGVPGHVHRAPAPGQSHPARLPAEDARVGPVRNNGGSKAQRSAAGTPVERVHRAERSPSLDRETGHQASAADFPPDQFTFSADEGEERLLDTLRQKPNKGKARERDGSESERARGQAAPPPLPRKHRLPAASGSAPTKPHQREPGKAPKTHTGVNRPTAGPSRSTKPNNGAGGSRSSGANASKAVYVERCGFDARGRPVNPDDLTQEEIRGHLVASLRETRWHENPVVQQIRDCSEDARDKGAREVSRLVEWCGVVTTLLSLSSPFGIANKFAISSIVVGDFLVHSDDWVQNCSKAQRYLLKRGSLPRLDEWLQLNSTRSMGMGRFATNLQAVVEGRDPV